MNSTRNKRKALFTLSVSEIVSSILKKEISCTSLVLSCLERVEEKEKVTQAWSQINKKQIFSEAKAIDAHLIKNLLTGVPIGWKDIIDCKGYNTGYGSPIYKKNLATVNASAVSMSLRSGAMVLGKTVTTEFATSFPGKTTNPHNAAHTPGGSSSGSAAAVADFMVPAAIGTQTGGSIIRPASFCGIVGFKPSFNTISRYGVKQVSDSLDTVGTFCRSVEDTALIISGLTGLKEYSNIKKIKPLRIGICHTVNWCEADSSMIDAVYKTGSFLSDAGVSVKDIRLPDVFNHLDLAHHDIEYFELSRALQSEYLNSSKLMSEAIKDRIKIGLQVKLAKYHSAIEIAEICKRLIINQIFSKFDLILTPSSPGEAPKGLASTGNASFNRVWTLLGLPCISLPGFKGPTNLPLGVQFIGSNRKDIELLSKALWIEKLLEKKI